jgi:hypothetical protein
MKKIVGTSLDKPSEITALAAMDEQERQQIIERAGANSGYVSFGIRPAAPDHPHAALRSLQHHFGRREVGMRHFRRIDARRIEGDPGMARPSIDHEHCTGLGIAAGIISAPSSKSGLASSGCAGRLNILRSASGTREASSLVTPPSDDTGGHRETSTWGSGRCRHDIGGCFGSGSGLAAQSGCTDICRTRAAHQTNQSPECERTARTRHGNSPAFNVPRTDPRATPAAKPSSSSGSSAP